MYIYVLMIMELWGKLMKGGEKEQQELFADTYLHRYKCTIPNLY